MLKRFEKLLEIAKDNEEFKKELADCLDKVESDRNLRLFEIKLFDKDEVKELAKSIFSESVFECLMWDDVRLLDDKLSFVFRVNGGDLSFKYSLKNYKLLDFEATLLDSLNLGENEVKRKKQICDEIKQRLNSFETLKSEIICHTVIKKVQENLKQEKITLLKSEVDGVKNKLDFLSDYISDIPNVSVSSVEYECDTIMGILRATQDILENY